MDKTSTDPLRARARRSYEVGRMTSALMWAPWPIGLALVAGFVGLASWPAAAVLGSFLMILVVAGCAAGGDVRRAAAWGLSVGTLGLVLGAVAIEACCQVGCAVDGSESATACGVVGLLVGGVFAYTTRSFARASKLALLAGATIALSASALGCALAGVGAVIGMGLGVLLSAAPLLTYSALRAE